MKESIKLDMMELWKETFHDSDQYIRLVFDTYFDKDNVFVRYHENRLIAALLGVTYEFLILTGEGKTELRKGLYLCGLATQPEFRGRGIMTELILEAEHTAKSRGFDYTFLIPADDHLREYYKRRGYRNISYRKIQSTSTETPCCINNMNIYTIKKLKGRDGATHFLESLAEWCRMREHKSTLSTIVHSERDILTAMAENENSIFLTEDTFNLKYPNLTKVVAVVFPEVSEAPEDVIRVVAVYTKDEREGITNNMAGHLLDVVREAVIKKHPGHRVEFVLPYMGTEKGRKGVEPYAMIKNLQESNNSDNDENLILQIFLMLD